MNYAIVLSLLLFTGLATTAQADDTSECTFFAHEVIFIGRMHLVLERRERIPIVLLKKGYVLDDEQLACITRILSDAQVDENNPDIRILLYRNSEDEGPPFYITKTVNK